MFPPLFEVEVEVPLVILLVLLEFTVLWEFVVLYASMLFEP